jgi:hypothetical protein
MKKIIIFICLFLMVSCSVFKTQEQKDKQEIINLVKDQTVLAILHKNIGDIDIPTEYYFLDSYMVVNNTEIIIYDYNNKLIKGWLVSRETLSEVLKSLKNK